MSNKTSGVVVWMTGLSGAGKTTVANGFVSALKKANIPIVMLDGDNMREILSAKWGYSTHERLELAYVYSRLCCHLANSGINVVCATVAMFEEVRNWNRENINNYLEVYLRVPVDVLVKRDPKGLYKKFMNDTSSESVLSDAFELPCFPDIIIDNYDNCAPEDAVWKTVNLFTQKLVYDIPVLEGEQVRHNFKAGITSYWDEVYSSRKMPEFPTDFSKFCAEKYIKKDDSIIEFGCGNGRDTFFFAKQNNITAIDSSSVVINLNKEKILNTGLANKINFIEGRFGEISLPIGTKTEVVYSRWTLHAMNEEAENLALHEAYNLLINDGLLLLEFRTTEDQLAKVGFSVGNNEKVTDHYRRFIDTKTFNQKLIDLGFYIDFFIASQGLARLDDSDPVVARIVARKL